MQESAFDTDVYLEKQYSRIIDKITAKPGSPMIMEFGGKPGDDQHAARVLPGYRPDAKIELLRQLLPISEIAMVVNARDILPPNNGRYNYKRIRGDSGLYYDAESLRLIDHLESKGLKPSSVVLSITPEKLYPEDEKIIYELEQGVKERGLRMIVHYAIKNYPSKEIINECPFEKNERIISNNQNLILFSPGGGSGKFGVALSEMYYLLKQGIMPNFIKFETFPVFNIDPRHPLNLAFEAATADLNNIVTGVNDGNGGKITTYDKDIENFALLKALYHKYFPEGVNTEELFCPADMGVNVIEKGIKDMDVVVKAAKIEIVRRLRRYIREKRLGIEKEITVSRTKKIWQEAKFTY